MDAELRCNRLTCRKTLIDKAVVTTCSHIFCVDCANELFNASRLCPACETSLTEPDDVVVCSLHPTNDYKTSVLSGLSPSLIMEICSRALSFWQYQVHQENSFQQAVIRNLNDKQAQLQKQLDNVIREANGEINLLSNKVAELERDMELERRKVHELQDSSREREKEYQKLKAQYDKAKRKSLLAPSAAPHGQGVGGGNMFDRPPQDDHNKGTAGVDIGPVISRMDANGIQRTPLVNRTMAGPFGPHQSAAWPQPARPQQRTNVQRRPFAVSNNDHSYRTNSISERSDSANEVENMLLPHFNRSKVPPPSGGSGGSGWGGPSPNARPRLTQQHQFSSNQAVKHGFRPAR
ncbi:uncharacterized protein HD556DRAFT_655782 [Suillus plorans]|uniref:RING-type domain-containing protein n=1 Tax=Suillus plorans TaxID=116603 RepID=A0A9P7AKN6_9AGAM|nr:uncharacterized protein HD556DRAFT_655782 [Suillus plorans]KAG1791436.1 hypothetical protein HD556DRAFT_655782 [Suillus plorans]